MGDAGGEEAGESIEVLRLFDIATLSHGISVLPTPNNIVLVKDQVSANNHKLPDVSLGDQQSIKRVAVVEEKTRLNIGIFHRDRNQNCVEGCYRLINP